jgi:hypothetical protein
MLTPREQGDFGELSAMQWLAWQGASVAIPLGNNRHWDVMAELDGRAVRVQVKTTRSRRLGRWEVRVSTSGGNQSWDRVVKLLDPSRFDYLFVLVGDGRRWFYSFRSHRRRNRVAPGRPQVHAEFEVESGAPIPGCAIEEAASTIAS